MAAARTAQNIGSSRFAFPIDEGQLKFAIHYQRSRDKWAVLSAPGADATACDLLSSIQFNSAARSLALCQRSSGSLARHFLTTRSSATGTLQRMRRFRVCSYSEVIVGQICERTKICLSLGVHSN